VRGGREGKSSRDVTWRGRECSFAHTGNLKIELAIDSANNLFKDNLLAPL